MEDFGENGRKNQIWIEKHRPKKLDDMISHEHIIKSIRNSVKKNGLQHMLFNGQPGSGKCLEPNTKILMYNGDVKKARYINTEDKIMGDDGTCRNVLSTTSGNDLMYKVTLENGDTFTCNSVHILVLYDTVTCDVIEIPVKDIDIKNINNYRAIKSEKIIWNDDSLRIRTDILNHFFEKHATIIELDHKVCSFHYEQNMISDGIIHIAKSMGMKVDISNNICTIDTNDDFENRLYKLDIVKLKRGQYCGFEIDGNKRFVLGDFTVTHNTSMIMACAREIYKDDFHMMVLNINASEERGIDTVRTAITDFVTSKNIFCNETTYKLVILDEADEMTTDAQNILRRVIEKHSSVARFCLICNYQKKISKPIQSRCYCYQFKPLTTEEIRKKVLDISEKENITVSEKAINILSKISKGDMRKVINILQIASLTDKYIDDKCVVDSTGYILDSDIDIITKSLFVDDFKTSSRIIIDMLTDSSYSISDIIGEIGSKIIDHVMEESDEIKNILLENDIDRFTIVRMLDILSELKNIEYNITISSSDNIHVVEFISLFKKN